MWLLWAECGLWLQLGNAPIWQTGGFYHMNGNCLCKCYRPLCVGQHHLWHYYSCAGLFPPDQTYPTSPSNPATDDWRWTYVQLYQIKTDYEPPTPSKKDQVKRQKKLWKCEEMFSIKMLYEKTAVCCCSFCAPFLHLDPLICMFQSI